MEPVDQVNERGAYNTVPIYTTQKSQFGNSDLFLHAPKMPPNIELLGTLYNTPENFEGGKLRHFASEWENLTKNTWVIETILGSKIDFDFDPADIPMPHPIIFGKIEENFIDQEIQKLESQYLCHIYF